MVELLRWPLGQYCSCFNLSSALTSELGSLKESPGLCRQHFEKEHLLRCCFSCQAILSLDRRRGVKAAKKEFLREYNHVSKHRPQIQRKSFCEKLKMKMESGWCCSVD
ncbi:uncharacterized protein WM277_020847 isoform 1-T1 [Molossus nigricans]